MNFHFIWLAAIVHDIVGDVNPIAIRTGIIDIHWYGIMMALAFLACLVICIYLGKKSGLDAGFMSDLTTWLMVSGILGARAAHVIANIDQYKVDPISVLYIHKGGLIYYGGFVGAAIGVGLFAMSRRTSVLKLYDIIIVALPLSHALGRVGCFLNGCCFGKATNWITGVSYPLNSEVGFSQLRSHIVSNSYVRALMVQLDNSQTSAAQFRDSLAALVQNGTIKPSEAVCVPVHPVQLYEAALNVVLSLGLLWYYRRRRLDGSVVATYLLTYPVVRFVIEFMRGDERQMLGRLTVAQAVSFAMFAGGIAGWLWLINRERTNPGSPSRCCK
ncbi:MAG: prolipoprotein diacylglyceryl transferase [bacterium]